MVGWSGERKECGRIWVCFVGGTATQCAAVALVVWVSEGLRSPFPSARLLASFAVCLRVCMCACVIGSVKYLSKQRLPNDSQSHDTYFITDSEGYCLSQGSKSENCPGGGGSFVFFPVV